MRARVCLALVALLLASVRGVPAQTPVAAKPANAAPCARPNVPASVATAIQPQTPPLAIEQDMSGRVTVRVRLDENAHVLDATISQSPWAPLNARALATIRKETFVAAVENCVPVASTLYVPIDFPKSVTTGALPDIAAYFIGTWYCTSDLGDQVVEAYGRDVFGGRVLQLFDAFVATDDRLGDLVQIYLQTAGVTIVSSAFGGTPFHRNDAWLER